MLQVWGETGVFWHCCWEGKSGHSLEGATDWLTDTSKNLKTLHVLKSEIAHLDI